MLRISKMRPNGPTTTFRLEGQLVGPWVDELKRVCEPLIKHSCGFALDLTDVAFVDEGGVTALIDLYAQGAKLLNASPFVEAQLGGDSSRPVRTPLA